MRRAANAIRESYRTGNIMTLEIPADVAPGMAAVSGMGGYLAIFRSQDTQLAPRRVTGMQGNTIVCDNDHVLTTAYYRYEIDLRPRSPGVAQPSAEAITRPTPPFAG